jgi:NTE family protein
MKPLGRSSMRADKRSGLPADQVVLVLQGGGALGAYQAGVYQGLHEAGVEPTWVVGTSIGAINAALICGNAPGDRLKKLQEFWSRVGYQRRFDSAWSWGGDSWPNLNTVLHGIPGFFERNPKAGWGLQAVLGADHAAFYSTEPLKATLEELVDFDYINGRHTRLTVGAVNVRSGDMKYFDCRHMPIGLEHIMASGALPPAFPAVRVDGEPFWDGGVYSNTPIEVVLDDHPRRDALIFAVNVWQPHGSEPATIWQVLGRHKDIQYASRAKSHVARQQEIHRLRHIINELCALIPQADREDPKVREMMAYGCKTTMQLVNLLAPRLDDEDHTKDIDFAHSSIRTRWQAGLADARRAVAAKPWQSSADPLDGVIVHDIDEC